jgi:cytosine/adenosine deaminase-related metal-dependent hydrolase
VQRRFGDGDADAWAERVAALPSSDALVVGAAVHSVRAVPAEQLHVVAAAAGERPLHVHLSEQPQENDACRARYGCSPTALLDAHGLLGRRTTAVHATHLDDSDVACLGRSSTTVCACPSTEADLADGLGPFRRLRDAARRCASGATSTSSPTCSPRPGRSSTPSGSRAASAGGFRRPPWSTP